MVIQKLRLQHGWSQEQLAELSGLSVRTIQRLERGGAGSAESLKCIAAVFGIDFNQLKEPAVDNPAPADLPPDEALAFAHVRKVKAFYVSLIWYAALMAFLAAINAMTYHGYWWAAWPALGWGIALVFQALSLFDLIPFLNGDWEKRQVEKFLGREL
ncbi:MAG TPA: helix-turn-helix domain-containing protein [Caulobacteraceae bacterium]|jgi:transcriptional regulator with XRE-family HTH domain|nr:helix-turn-helix domain-containing protein [Caulobacteraceae bacterium]